jgi:hypothetical protein
MKARHIRTSVRYLTSSTYFTDMLLYYFYTEPDDGPLKLKNVVHRKKNMLYNRFYLCVNKFLTHMSRLKTMISCLFLRLISCWVGHL